MVIEGRWRSHRLLAVAFQYGLPIRPSNTGFQYGLPVPATGEGLRADRSSMIGNGEALFFIERVD